MARKRKGDDFDDEDDRPRRRRRDDEPGSGMGLWLGLGLGVAAVVVVGVIVLVVSSRKKKEEVAPTPTPQPAPKRIEAPSAGPAKGQVIRTAPAKTAPHGNPGANWQRAIGTWRRQQLPDEDGQRPVEFEFRKDFTASARHNRPNDTIIHDSLVEVQFDQGEHLTLVLHIENGQYNYGFKVQPDGTMVLQGYRSGDLVFVRAK